ncbi:succinylglutamate desuccinylase/aspartoacylase family protein [Planctomicrobium sp. SH527]|uniref:succinylglutamate desuccinylase/aspartoacylase family protein n=1 Tax=Planctomicrobium sp. SH527 TaxID=3448123 RepID=UPI003F5B15F2
MLVRSHTIHGQQSGKNLLILGGIHGDEFEPIAAIRELMKTIDVTNLRGQVTFVPIANEPAFTEAKRTGPDGLDLARTFPGKSDGTITEKIASEINHLIQQSDYLIDLHTGGIALDIVPLTGYMLHPNEEILQCQKRMAKAFNLPLIWGTDPNLNGRSLSAARDANVPAIYAEWGGGTGLNPDGVNDYVTGCLQVMSELGMYAYPAPLNRVTTIVHDSRSESGVLQKNYPAEVAGLFEPVVRLKDEVKSGDLIGWIHRFDGNDSSPIKANQNGMILLLRAIPSVKHGDCLAVVLEASQQDSVHE